MELCLDFCTQQHTAHLSLKWAFNAKFPKATSCFRAFMFLQLLILLKIENILCRQARLRVIQAGLPGMCVLKDSRL